MKVDDIEVHTVPGRNNLKPNKGEYVFPWWFIAMVSSLGIITQGNPHGVMMIPMFVLVVAVIILIYKEVFG